MNSIYLIGFMGSGKTTIANRLGAKLHLAVQDTDKMIELYYQMKIKDIFLKYGEKTFREYEQEILGKVEKINCIVSTGGGIIETPDNVLELKKNQTIYLQTSWEVIMNRLKGDTGRPIWNNQDVDKQALLHKREGKYIEAASIIVNTDGKSTNQIVTEIITLIDK
ncbi:shikimate kinase [Paraliobacillus sediminis]|uniref:shikimate kinase n=1 Tax=Paraliobacillus sediminis TaxID=1885916 RepID=UPI000E3BEDF7|nr:shikimate kinase [Paraliobacillus sediminis]